MKVLNLLDKIITNQGIETLRGEVIKTPFDTIYTIEDVQGNTYLYSKRLNLYETINKKGTSIKANSLDAFTLTLNIN